ncbi:MAG: twin-arginine translocase TatA/TatE family subunit [Rikenellaceae bacterium]|nr:twin-arginine translocase TatA/TatE family subunit [Rikenellaceae bacterium]
MAMDFLFIGGIGGSELLLIVFVLLLLFGGKKLPELMKGLGRGIRDFKDAVSSETEQIKEVIEDK